MKITTLAAQQMRELPQYENDFREMLARIKSDAPNALVFFVQTTDLVLWKTIGITIVYATNDKIYEIRHGVFYNKRPNPYWETEELVDPTELASSQTLINEAQIETLFWEE